MPTLSNKPTLDDLIKGFTPLYKDAVLEEQFARQVESTARALLNFQRISEHDPVQTLVSFLRADAEFLNIVLSLANLSAEKFKRILSAERFAQANYGAEWGLKKITQEIRRNDQYATRIAKLFLEGQNNPTLIQQVADFYLAQIELPENWEAVIRDEKVVKNLIRRKLTGKYNDAKGKAIERLVRLHLERVRDTYGVSFEHGQVKLVQKEVDFAAPTLSDPYVMIMISYMETTGSGQTARANEQNKMYQEIVGLNVRYPKEQRILVNVIDGAGWLARRSDLRKMHAGCHYALTLKMLEQLEAIICKYVPTKFFTVSSRPKVEMV